jgi:hypothetical protein
VSTIATRDEILSCVIDSLKEFVPHDKEKLTISGEMSPIRDFGLTSEDGVDYACSLSEKLDFHIPDDVNPFVDDGLKRPRTVAGMVELLCKLIKIEGEQ